MKYGIVIILCIFSGISAVGQSIQFLDSTLFECRYKCLQNKGDDECILRYGKDVSQFFSFSVHRTDSLIATPQGGEVVLKELEDAVYNPHDTSKQLKGSVISREYLYYNWPKGKLSLFAQVFFSHYQIEEDIPNIEWKLLSDSTKDIMGYKCQLAIANFRGRIWYAWYSLDIPVSLGPWKLSGLPGLILEAYDDKNFIRFKAFQLAFRGLEPVRYFNYLNCKYEKILRDKYLKVKKTANYPSSKEKTVRPAYIELN